MNLIRRMNLQTIMVLLITFCMMTVFYGQSVAASTETDLYLSLESFTWKEFDESGEELLEESGPIYGLGVLMRSDIGKYMVLSTRGEFTWGSVDYDGQTQIGTPVKTDTNYYGYRIEGDLGVKVVATETFAFGPFAGLGYRWWSRDLQSTSSATGYEERWSSFYARLGIHAEGKVSQRVKLFAQAGLKVPISNKNKVDLGKFGLSEITIEPGKENTLFADAGMKMGSFVLTVFYESMRFPESDPDDTYGVFYQPESEADIYGVNIGIAF